jgi:hypothetical protein
MSTGPPAPTKGKETKGKRLVHKIANRLEILRRENDPSYLILLVHGQLTTRSFPPSTQRFTTTLEHDVGFDRGDSFWSRCSQVTQDRSDWSRGDFNFGQDEFRLESEVGALVDRPPALVDYLLQLAGQQGEGSYEVKSTVFIRSRPAVGPKCATALYPATGVAESALTGGKLDRSTIIEKGTFAVQLKWIDRAE